MWEVLVNKIKTEMIPNLAYKYLTSISAINENALIKGMYIFYGITDDIVNSESFYDVRISGAKEISPEIRMVPMSEEVPYKYQENNLFELIRRLK